MAQAKDFFTSICQTEPTFLGEVIPISGSGDLTNDESYQRPSQTTPRTDNPGKSINAVNKVSNIPVKIAGTTGCSAINCRNFHKVGPLLTSTHPWEFAYFSSSLMVNSMALLALPQAGKTVSNLFKD